MNGAVEGAGGSTRRAREYRTFGSCCNCWGSHGVEDCPTVDVDIISLAKEKGLGDCLAGYARGPEDPTPDRGIRLAEIVESSLHRMEREHGREVQREQMAIPGFHVGQRRDDGFPRCLPTGRAGRRCVPTFLGTWLRTVVRGCRRLFLGVKP